MSTYEIQIRQRSGKWVVWCERATLPDIQVQWKTIPGIRRKARCVKLDNGTRKVLAAYNPPQVGTSPTT